MNARARESIQAALPAYEIANELGRGAFGVVYDARHTQLGRRVAIKQLPQAFAADPAVRERFVAEAQMVASLDHPHIVPVYDFVDSDGACLLIMERCEGSVGDRFKADGIVTDEACAAVLASLAALDFAHEQDLLHRDIKPENLMYDTKGVVKLGDFGIARALDSDIRRTATGMVVGTPAYMSPEQCRGDDLTPASDLYSVGMMAYELLTGGLPFPDTKSINGLIAHHLVTPPLPLLATRPELPGSIGEVIDRSLSKDLNVRHATALELATDLARACVTAFGSGWLRRRRFVLHWPEIIAETERADDNSPRTGTIMVRAGDVPHVIITPDEAMAAKAPASHEGPTGPPDVSGGTLVTEPGYDSGRPVASVAPEEAPAPSAQPPIAATPGGAAAAESSGPNKLLLGGIAAAVVALIVGIIVITGGGSDDPTVTESSPSAVDSAQTEAEADPEASDQGGAAAEEPLEEASTADAADDTSNAEGESSPTALPVVPSANLLTARPADLDTQRSDSPWIPTPCPDEPERVACILAGVSVDQDTGEITVPYFTEGFVPELEPADYHVHFYLDTVVNGDETKAGTETPGGSWKVWDAPYPATSFGGDQGRSLFTLADYEAAGARYLCSLVADGEQRALPGTGNCAPLAQLSNVDELSRQVNRLEGIFVGRCAIGATAIAPPDWRWFELVDTPLEELVSQIRPGAPAVARRWLEPLVERGGVVWADGPIEDDFLVNFSISTFPGDFGLNDTPAEVGETIEKLGISREDATIRSIGGRDIGYRYVENDTYGIRRYVIPDFGYVIVMDFAAPQGSGWDETADAVADTIVGC